MELLGCMDIANKTVHIVEKRELLRDRWTGCLVAWLLRPRLSTLWRPLCVFLMGTCQLLACGCEDVLLSVDCNKLLVGLSED